MGSSLRDPEPHRQLAATRIVGRGARGVADGPVQHHLPLAPDADLDRWVGTRVIDPSEEERAMTLGRDLVDLVTGRRPEVRNRVKFCLLSPIYDGFYRFLPADPHAEIERRIPRDARRLLDLCTGTALVPARVARLRPELAIVGLDLSPEMLAIGQQKLSRQNLRNATLVRADAGTLPFADGTFDAVSVSYGLHELPTAVRHRALAEIQRVLRPGGRLVVADLDRPPRFGFLVDLYLMLGEPAHAREVIGDGLVRLLDAAGFSVAAEPAAGAMPMQLLIARLREPAEPALHAS